VRATTPNQPPPFEGTNLFAIDVALQQAVERDGAGGSTPALREWGAVVGSADTYALAAAANRHAPVLHNYDRRGERIDDVEFHPAWHALMRLAMDAGEHCAPWRSPGAAAHVARAARYYLHAQVENGTQCPLTMTYASWPVLARYAATLPGANDVWLPRILGSTYDPRMLPVAQKTAALIGMGMTERQGGSDVRANVSRAEPDADGAWRITGHKWFFSAPQCDAHLVLAQAGTAPGCFLVPRINPDGLRNGIRINRLKDKLGNRSNASAEVEFDRALAWPVGATDRGIATILEMVHYTRLDCVIASAGLIRAALTWSLHHARHRMAFGRRLVEHPLMVNVLADIALESEAALLLAMFVARSCDAQAQSGSRGCARIVTPAAKYWVCKRAIAVTAEAMEVLGGSGYIEDGPLPRWYREAPVNSIWEGSGNVVCLDVERAMRREPDSVEALLQLLGSTRGGNDHYDRFVLALETLLRRHDARAADARRIAQAVALAVAASELIRTAPPAVADAYCASRLRDDALTGAALGTLADTATGVRILERALA
jgi:putative acyl-CoA dehydrogenase